MNRKTLSSKQFLNFEFKSLSTKSASGELFIEGYANTVGKDRVGDVVDPKAFSKSLPTYLSNPILLAQHDWSNVAGKVTFAEIDGKGLKVRARISDTREDLKTLIREGCLSTMSIGFNELESNYDEQTKTKHIKDLELLEISVVSIPANTEARFAPVEGEKSTPTGETKEASQPAPTAEAVVEQVTQPVEPEAVKAAPAPTSESQTPSEDHMTKQELLDQIKSAQAEVQAAVVKTEEPTQGEDGKEDPTAQTLKEIAARLGQLADGMAKLLEIQAEKEKEPKEEESSDEPSEEEPAQDDEKSIEELEKFVSELESELSGV